MPGTICLNMYMYIWIIWLGLHCIVALSPIYQALSRQVMQPYLYVCVCVNWIVYTETTELDNWQFLPYAMIT